MTLTDREHQFIRALASKIRLLTFEQLSGMWWPDTDSGRTNARRRLGELAEHGLLARTRVHARPLLTLEGPLCRWKPGEPEPDFQALAYRLHERWREPLRTMTAYLATRRAAGIFGGVAEGRMKNPSQASHDIHLSGVYLHFLKTAPTLAAGWVGEDVLAPSRIDQKLLSARQLVRPSLSSSDPPDRLWQLSLREFAVLTPTVQLPITTRRLQRRQG